MKYFRINNEPWVPFFFEKKNIHNFKTNSSDYVGNLKKNTNFHKRMGKEQAAISIIT
jgi:hypothetical protein